LLLLHFRVNRWEAHFLIMQPRIPLVRYLHLANYMPALHVWSYNVYLYMVNLYRHGNSNLQGACHYGFLGFRGR
jgi:hypothetical protein